MTTKVDTTPLSTRSIAVEWTDSLNRHDPEAAATFIDEACVFTNVGTGQRIVGRAAILQDMVHLMAMWSELHIETTNLHVADDTYIKEWIMTGVHTGDVPGLPATGRSFRLLGAGVGKTHDGKITSLTEYWNMAAFLQQIGT